MKAKKINEVLDFERGLEPKESMNIGKGRITAEITHAGDGSSVYISVGDKEEIYYLTEEDDDNNVLWNNIERIATQMGAKYIHDSESEPEKWKIGKFNESLDFERGIDPKRAMDLGIFYKKWREDHDGKILFTYMAFLKDPMGNQRTYWVHLYYSTTNVSHGSDSVYFDGERLIGGWGFSGTPHALGNMQNKPTNMFNKEEATFWDDPKVFNKIIDQLTDKKKAEKWFREMTEEWFEDGFDTMMRKWFRSGVCRVDHSELKFKG